MMARYQLLNNNSAINPYVLHLKAIAHSLTARQKIAFVLFSALLLFYFVLRKNEGNDDTVYQNKYDHPTTTKEEGGDPMNMVAMPTDEEDGENVGAVGGELKILTWNVGAINNNPFEYWLTIKNEPMYDEILNKVESFVNTGSTSKQNVEVSSIFTNDMFEKLLDAMKTTKSMKTHEDYLDRVRRIWLDDYSKRTCVDFLKDPIVGKKRLVSMPDRITNTMLTSTGKTIFRPTPINCYDGEVIKSVSDWYKRWLKFMFQTKVKDEKTPFDLLEKISKNKYPVITESEEEISIPLQTLVIAIFDALQIRMLNRLGGADTWQELRTKICTELNLKKSENVFRILKSNIYRNHDVLFLQEMSVNLMEMAKKAFSNKDYVVITPQQKSKSDQSSVIVLRREKFDVTSITDVSSKIRFQEEEKTPVAAGDLLVIQVNLLRGKNKNLVLASFHGDTNGLATIPVTQAIANVLESTTSGKSSSSPPILLFGLDANTYEKPEKDTQSFTEYSNFLKQQLNWFSVWDVNNLKANPGKIHTTRNARTYMQPQLSKAAKKSEVDSKGDANPKDFLISNANVFKNTKQVFRDNTGSLIYTEGMVFPTLSFPSDHAILSCSIEL